MEASCLATPDSGTQLQMAKSKLSIRVPDDTCAHSSPRKEFLRKMLTKLNQRQVTVKHLALFYTDEDSLANMPIGLRSLTIVILDGEGKTNETNGEFKALQFSDATWNSLRQLQRLKVGQLLI
jgi:hypothetical protein